MSEARRAPILYLITDRRATAGRPLDVVVARALAGAADAGASPGTVAVQLREKDLDARALLDLARPLRAITQAHAAAFYVNDRVDVALAAGADGVHLGGTSMRPADVASIAPPLGTAVSAHAAADLAQGADSTNLRFAVLGPIFETPSKRSYGAPLGLGVLAATCSTVARVPVLAIGGVTVENARACVDAGATGIACIRAVLTADDPRKIAFLLCRAILDAGRP